MNVVELEGVEVRRGSRLIVSHLSLSVRAGERLALLGPNGAGKSSLVEVMLGLHVARAGRVRVFGQTPPVGGTGFVPQDVCASFLPWLSVRDNVTLPLRLHGASAARRARALEEARELFDPRRSLELDASSPTLSTGQLQLAALLRAVIGRPKLMVCDEPFSALDVVAKQHVKTVLADLGKTPHAPALVLVTHEAAEAAALTDRCITLSPGIAQGPCKVVGAAGLRASS